MVLALGGLAIFAWLVFFNSSQPPSPQQGGTPNPVSSVSVTPNQQPNSRLQNLQQQPNNQAQRDVQAAFATQIPAGNPDNTKLYNTVIVDNYALQLWIGDNMGGEGLLKYDAATSKWAIVSGGGGAWNVEDLVLFGVPTTTATSLIAGLPAGY